VEDLTRMPGFTFIYALVDPRNDQVRYVGKANDPHRRYIGHLYEQRMHYRAKNPYKRRWLDQLTKMGLKPQLRVLERVSLQEWPTREVFWIAHYRNFGARLTNLHEGGQGGGVPGRRCSEETKRKMSEALRGRKLSSEQVEFLRKINTGRIKSDEERRKLSEALKGKTHRDRRPPVPPVSPEERKQRATEARQKRAEKERAARWLKTQCAWCGAELIRCPLQVKQCKSGLFFCNRSHVRFYFPSGRYIKPNRGG
jgi:NUMOD3 motif-containing protein